MGQEIPKYLRASREAEPWRLYWHDKMQKEAPLFAEIFVELDNKKKVAESFVGRLKGLKWPWDREEYAFCRIDSEEEHRPPEKKWRYFLTIGPIEEGFSTHAVVCIFLQKMWNPDSRKYEYTYARRKIKFELGKLEKTALNIIEQNPPEDRKWFEEVGVESFSDGRDFKKTLSILLEDIRSLHPVPWPQKLYEENKLTSLSGAT